MSNYLSLTFGHRNSPRGRPSTVEFRRFALVAVGLGLGLMLAGCQTPPQFGELAKPAKTAAQSDSMVLHEGDKVRISFPGSPDLNTVQQIRRDGKIALPIIGEFTAAGMTPIEMERKLIELYGPQLVTKEVRVAVETSSFPVYITGAVLRPGKLTYERPVTALEAVMEAGVDYAKANLKAVAVIRHHDGNVERFALDLKRVLQGQQSEPFNLKPSDIIFVPERFSWF